MRAVILLLATVFGAINAVTSFAQGEGEYLDMHGSPIYGTITLSPGFNEPHQITMTVNSTAVDLFRVTGEIHNLASCAGFTSNEPMLRVVWTGGDEEDTLTFLFENDEVGGDPTMLIHIINQRNDSAEIWCSDDFGNQLQPMITVDSLPSVAWINVWVGNYYPGPSLPGTLYIFQTPAGITQSEPSPTPPFGSIWSRATYLGGLLIEEYCRAVIPAYPDARPLRGEDLSWACWSRGDAYREIDLTAVCVWQYGEDSYAVQTGRSFLTYACFRQGSVADYGTPVAIATPVKLDYSNARSLPIGRQAMVVTGGGEPLPIHREPGLGRPRFAYLPPGTVVEVLAGPVYADGCIWWEVRAPTSITGWMVAYGDRAETLLAVSDDIP